MLRGPPQKKSHFTNYSSPSFLSRSLYHRSPSGNIRDPEPSNVWMPSQPGTPPIGVKSMKKLSDDLGQPRKAPTNSKKAAPSSVPTTVTDTPLIRPLRRDTILKPARPPSHASVA